jgi:hypothetical protein
MEDKSFKKASFREKLGMAKNFAKSVISRGLNDKKVDMTTKQLRVISCFGDDNDLIPCEYLRQSEQDSTKSFCGGCGCGDRKATWLIADGSEYSKLDYPKLSCPLQMPGFTNYEESEPAEAEEPVTRRYYIEQMDITDISDTKVTLHNAPEPDKK